MQTIVSKTFDEIRPGDATAGSDEKCLAAASFGADGCFRYDDPQLKEKVLNATRRRGVNCISRHVWSRSHRSGSGDACH